MHRLSFIALAIQIFLLLSCGDQNRIDSKAAEKIQLRKSDTFLNEIFEHQFPNYETNAIVRQDALKALVKVADSLVPLGYLEDIPLKVLRVQENPHGKGAIVHFYTTSNLSPTILSDRLQYDVIGLMNDTLAKSIDETKLYFIKGKKYKRLNKTEVFSIVNQVYFSPESEIQANVIDNSLFQYLLGDYLCEVERVTPIN